MRHPGLSRHGLVVLALGLIALPARAGEDCDAPLSRWQTREAVRQMASAQGWQIQRLKIDDGCYEIRGTDAQGRHFKAKLDPETLKVLKLKQDEHRRARPHDRQGGQGAEAARQPPPPPGAASAPTTPPTTLPTTPPEPRPRGQID